MATDDLAIARAAAALARAHGTTLTDALGWFVDHGRTARAAPPVEVCVGLFLADRRAAGRRPETLAVYRIAPTNFSARFSGPPPPAIPPPGIRRVLSQWAHPPTPDLRW